ncbi:hypothetical protein SNE40_019124 [Patella caerulea]|uniref:Uncharacterized protein n=1 Tax=Patella caerulea TaxID=87958 RepID=A0AAN8J9Z8_PATCE
MTTRRPTSTRSTAQKQLGSRLYIEKPDFPNGIFPTKTVIVENMMYLMRPSRAGQEQRPKDNATLILAELLQEHWIFCNVYTIRTNHIKNKILKLYSDFTNLIQTRKERRNESTMGELRNSNKQQTISSIFSVRIKLQGHD